MRRNPVGTDPTAGQINKGFSDLYDATTAMQSDIDYLAEQGSQVSEDVSTLVSNLAIPGAVTGISISESGYTIDGVVYSEVTATYTAPTPLDTFTGIFLVAKNYRGSAQLVKVAEHHFAGAAGTSASFKTTLQRTGETVTFYFVAKNSNGGTVEDWATAPSTTGVLDGNASAPNAPTGLAATSTNTGISLSWNANAESNLAGYKLYRNTTNNFGTASLLNNVGTTRSGAPNYFDATGSYVAVYYYWVTAVNTAAQESSNSAVASGVSGGNAVTGVVAQGNFGLTEASTSVSIYWDGTNGSNAFTLRLADASTKSIPTGSTTITGLSSGVTYKFYPYYDVLSNAVAFVTTGGAGSPAIAFASTSSVTVLSTAAAETAYPGRIALAFTSIQITTTGGGGGGGTGGGGGDVDCIAPWMEVETQRGIIPIEELQVGDTVTTPQGDSTVIRLKNPPQTALVQLRLESGHTFDCSPTHPIALLKDKWRYAGELKLGDVLITSDGESRLVEWKLKPLNYVSVLPHLEPYHEFYCNGVLTHNNIAIKY
jgi:hypothetical protein